MQPISASVRKGLEGHRDIKPTTAVSKELSHVLGKRFGLQKFSRVCNRVAELPGKMLMNNRRQRVLHRVTEDRKLAWIHRHDFLHHALSQRLAVCLEDLTRA